MRENVVRELLKIREEIESRKVKPIENEEDLSAKIVKLSKKIDTLHEMIKGNKVNKNVDQSPVKTRKRNQVMELVEKNIKLSSYDLSFLMNISRTRANEYLKELERDGLLKNELIDKKMYYRVVK
ncbi:hypothetical protein ACFLQN_01365 [Candidatus Aenigmatarchaeota archaeon]